MDSKRPAHLKCAPVLNVGMAKLTAVGPSVGDFVKLLPLLALPEYELLLVPDLALFDDDDASYITNSPKAAAVVVDLLADEFDDEPTPTLMAAATSAAINRNPRTTSLLFFLLFFLSDDNDDEGDDDEGVTSSESCSRSPVGGLDSAPEPRVMEHECCRETSTDTSSPSCIDIVINQVDCY